MTKPGWLDNLKLEKRFKTRIDSLPEKLAPIWGTIDNKVIYNQDKILRAFQKEKISEDDFQESTGYGYHDAGREKLENLFSRVFGGEKSLVRPHLVSGTHTLSVCLFGILRPGERLLSVSGPPYDTLLQVIEGKTEACRGTLKEWGIDHQQLPLLPSGCPALKELPGFLENGMVKAALIQKSPGYNASRGSLTVENMAEIIEEIRKFSPDTIILVDNCYGELVETREPLEAGADLVAGSLIKNPGGGLAPTGGYVTGKSKFVDAVAARLTAPGLEGNLGSMGDKRLYFAGLFQAPQLVGNALKTATWAAAVFQELGYKVDPLPEQERGDLVQKIKFNEPELVKLFIEAIQNYSPVDSYLTPEPSEVPGYQDPVVMAAGTFIQGASGELSADAPMRPPYAGFLQGGLTLPHGLIAVTRSAEQVFLNINR